MKILSLDLSTKTGWAVLEHPKLLGYGLIAHSPHQRQEAYPKNFLLAAKEIALRVLKLVDTYKPDVVVIEETNQGGKYVGRFDSKILEYIHMAVADALIGAGKTPHYIDSKKWQSMVGTTLDKDQRAHNKELKEEREKAKEKLRRMCEQAVEQQFARRVLSVHTPAEKKALKKEMKESFKRLFRSESRRIRVTSSKGVVGKVTSKHLSVAKVNDLFKLGFTQKDNDICDAILIGVGFLKLQKEKTHGDDPNPAPSPET